MAKAENITLIPLTKLQRWDRNYRVHDLESIITSFVRFGFNSALKVWREGTVMAGNGSLIALEIFFMIRVRDPEPRCWHASRRPGGASPASSSRGTPR